MDSRVTGLVMSFEFTKKQGFKLKNIKRSIYMRNVDGMFNKERLIKKYREGEHLLPRV